MNEHSVNTHRQCGVICSRCQGMMIQDQVVRLDPTIRLELWRCLNCGDLVDGTVLQNRLTPPQRQRHYPHRRALVSQPQLIQGRRSGGIAGVGQQ